MSGLVILVAFIFIILPIISLVSISNMSSKVSRLEESIMELKGMLSKMSLPRNDIAPERPEEHDEVRITETIQTEKESPVPLDTSAAELQIPQETPAPHVLKEEALPVYVSEAPSAEPEEKAPKPEEVTANYRRTMQREEPPRPVRSVIQHGKESRKGGEEEGMLFSLTKHLQGFYSWLLKEGNIWVSVGVLLFLAGFGLLFSYIAQMGLLSIEMRLAGSAAIGIAMAAFGWKMRERRRTYALILQGGGIGVLYIVLLAGAKLGPIIPVTAAIIGMLLLCAFTIILALFQDFEPLALFALLGGFAAPILVSTGSDNFVALFSIYSLLNLEILLITTQKDWRKIRWGGLLASAFVGIAWGRLRWSAQYLAAVEPFIVLMFVTYSAITMIPLLSHIKNVRRIKNRGMADTPMMMTLPFVFLFLQMPAVSHTKYGVAISCLALGAWYLLTGRFLIKNEDAAEAGFSPRIFLVYCILFSNLAVPFIFKQAVSSSIWAIEGAILIAYSARERRSGGTFACGILLHAAAFMLYNFAPYTHLPAHLYGVGQLQSGLMNWKSETSPFLLTGLLFAVSALASSYFTKRLEETAEGESPSLPIPKLGLKLQLPSTSAIVWAFAIYGTAWWKLSAYHAAFVTMKGNIATALSILSLGAIAGYVLSMRFKWDAARFLSFPAIGGFLFFSLPLGHSFFAFTGVYQLFESSPIFAKNILHSQALSWVLFAAMFAAALRTYRRDEGGELRRVTWGILLFTFLIYTEHVMSGFSSMFPMSSERYEIGLLMGFLPIAAAVVILTQRRFKERIGLEAYEKQSVAAISFIVLTRLPAFITSLWNTRTGMGSFYIPLLNPLEFRQILYLASAGLILHSLHENVIASASTIREKGLRYVLPFAGFVLLNSIAARAAFLYFGERVSWGAISQAPHFQGIIAILWGLTALSLIFGSKKLTSRFPWFLGAGLLALDIVKLMLIDLRNSATLIRILAFLVLGGLFLVIGWIAPLPPKQDTDEMQGDIKS